MAQSDQERLLSVIRASDLLLREDGDSEDPVASRRVAEALAQKASALWELGRLAQAVDVWDELITHYDRDPATRASLVIATVLFLKGRDLEQIGRHHEALAAVTELIERSQSLPPNDAVTLVVVRALAVRARALAALGSVDQAVACDEEMVARADRGEEPELREWAAWALEHQSRVLIAAEQIDRALTASARLTARLLDEPSEPSVTVIEIINNHSLLLLQVGAPKPRGGSPVRAACPDQHLRPDARRRHRASRPLSA